MEEVGGSNPPTSTKGGNMKETDCIYVCFDATFSKIPEQEQAIHMETCKAFAAQHNRSLEGAVGGCETLPQSPDQMADGMYTHICRIYLVPRDGLKPDGTPFEGYGESAYLKRIV